MPPALGLHHVTAIAGDPRRNLDFYTGVLGLRLVKRTADIVSPMPTAFPPTGSAEAELRSLVDEYRTRCLWFLRDDLYPGTRQEALRVLEQIERHGDRDAFIRAGRIRRWLSQTSSAPSAAS